MDAASIDTIDSAFPRSSRRPIDPPGTVPRFAGKLAEVPLDHTCIDSPTLMVVGYRVGTAKLCTVSRAISENGNKGLVIIPT